MKPKQKFQMKDCLERKSFESRHEAELFVEWWQKTNHLTPTPFKCRRCERWHIAQTAEKAESSQRRLKKTRLLSDRDLHLQLARQAGCSLEELQTRLDLTKIKINGAGAETVFIKRNKKPWD